MIDLTGKRIIISRTDSIGDVVLTLPICNWIKSNFKDVTLIFLGRGYTKPIVDCSQDVDEFIDWDTFKDIPKANKKIKFRTIDADVIIHVFPNKEIAALAKTLRVPVRVGTSHRMYHLLTCSHRIDFTRKRSDKHESQLNFELLRPFGIKTIPPLEEVNGMLRSFKAPKVDFPNEVQSYINGDKYIILHPKSQGSAKEWPIGNHIELANSLNEKGFKVIFTGTQAEGDLFRDELPKNDLLFDSTGKLTLQELITTIGGSNGLVACSTGPLHIAGILDRKAIGIFSPRKPIHPGRWQPLGNDSKALVFDKECPKCKKGEDCGCLEDISVKMVLSELL